MNKKDIKEAINSLDRTTICRAFKKETGRSPKGVYGAFYDVCGWAETYATSKRQRNALCDLFLRTTARPYTEEVYKGVHGHFEPLRLQRAVDELKFQIERGWDNYSKVPMVGRTNLYFCSPSYGHSDYNKWCTGIKIAENKRFGDTIIELSKKYL